MATRRLVLRDLYPDNGGNAYPKPSNIDDANDLFPHERIALKDAGDGSVVVVFQVPSNYVGSPKFYARWLSTVTTGNCRLTASYQTVAVGASMDPSAAEETLTAVDSPTDATARDLNETDLGAATAGNFTVDDEVMLKLLRSGGHANDTLAAECLLESLIFEYADV